MFKKYKEILFGIVLGAAMWLVDALMHAKLGPDVSSHGFWAELFEPNPVTLIFRMAYFVLAIAFGVFLWRSNWREREVRALEQAITAFQRQLDPPALRILSHVRQLQTRNSIALDETAAHLTEEIGMDARVLDELAQRYLHFSEQVRAGHTAEAVKTLQELDAMLDAQSSRQTVKS